MSLKPYLVGTLFIHILCMAGQENTVYKGIINTCFALGINLAETIKGVQVMY